MRLKIHLLLAMVILTLADGCGLKRNLELPGHGKYKTQNQQSATPAPGSQTTQTQNAVNAPGGGGATMPATTTPADPAIAPPSLSSTDSATPPSGSDNTAVH